MTSPSLKFELYAQTSGHHLNPPRSSLTKVLPPLERSTCIAVPLDSLEALSSHLARGDGISSSLTPAPLLLGETCRERAVAIDETASFGVCPVVHRVGLRETRQARLHFRPGSSSPRRRNRAERENGARDICARERRAKL